MIGPMIKSSRSVQDPRSKKDRTAIDVDGLPVNTAAFLGREQQCHRSNFIRSYQSILRTHLLNRIQGFFRGPARLLRYVLDPASGHVSIDIARTDGVRGNAFTGKFEG